MPGKMNKLGIGTNKYRKATYLLIDGKLTCPCCLKQNKAWHIHHFVNKVDKGRDIKQNLVVLCAICHRTTHEEVDDIGMVTWEYVRDLMWGKYGLVNFEKEILRKAIETHPNEDWSKISTFRKLHNYLKIKSMYRFFDHIESAQQGLHPTGGRLGIVKII